MSNLPTNYVDDVLNADVNTRRKYQMIQNGDGTVSLVDVTDYSTTGSTIGAAEINAQNTAINKDTKNVSWYGTCSTAAATTAKVATTTDTAFALATGAKVKIKFTNANTASAPTLNVDSKGAKAIKAYGTTAPTSWWKAGDIVEFTYDGTNWIMGATQGEIEQINTNLSVKVGGEITNYTNVENLAYDSTNKKLMVKVEGADTPVPFSSGAKYIGIYSSATTIDVSDLGATSANQFIVETHNAASASNGNTDRMLDIAFYQASLSFSNGRLTVYPASFAATQYSKWGSDPRANVYASVSGTIPTRVYFVGDITNR